MRKTVKKVLSLSIASAMVVTLLPATGVKAEENTVEVTIRSQVAGEYLNGIAQVTTVSSDEAENFGYTDTVTDGVSVLDAMVAEHKTIFGDEFETRPQDFLKVSEAGYVSMLFGVETYANGFLLNQGYPNDGTESSYGGYNGTTVNQTEIKDGDVIDFLTYADDTDYSDNYSFIEAAESVLRGEKVEVTVSSVMYMMGYMYGTPEQFKEAAEPVEEAGLVWIDPDTGAATAIPDVETDEDGKATITAPDEVGVYYLAAVGDEYIPLIKNPAKITVVDPVADALKNMDAEVTVQAQSAGEYLAAPKSLKVNGYVAESYGYVDQVTDAVSTLDVLVAETMEIFGADEFAADPTAYLKLSDSGWIETIFKEETGACSFYVNNEMPITLLNATAVFDADDINFFVYKDKVGYSDCFTKFTQDTPKVATAGEAITVALVYNGYDANWNQVELPLVGAKVGMVDLENGKVTELEGALTDENGNIDIIFGAAGEYYVTAFGTLATGEQLIMNPVMITVNESTAPAAVTNPKAVSLKSAKAGKKKMTVKWKKSSEKGVTGYQIRYSRYKSMKKAKTVTVKSVNTTSKVIKKLKKGKKYYVQVRTYKKVNDKTYTSSWSKKASVKIK